ncbi:oxygen-dependent coproporphyrinogen-III oxidase, mitochondrial-like isoform X2 [Clytia hemisphaerica]|uniref:oxygen-dependent coproporphyrinogen-III oxidase, mitochondrial-like isoform X2 n=1 Tax=Clytia hemisphaerica TaxID=252671 RepID=UPI0034D545FE
MANREFLQKIDQFTSEDFCAESINCLQSLKNESKTDVKCRMELFTMYLQEKLVSALQSYEPTRCFCIDRWLKDDTGGGISCVLQDGVSCIIHPKNPFVPSMHFNFRYFETSNNEDEIGHFWFGGGIDMTPTYLDQQDAEHFHQTIKTACDKHDKDYYPRYKKLCDDSLFLEICDEYRGIGGFHV